MRKWIQVNPSVDNRGLRGRGDENVDPGDLPISGDLRERVAAWTARLREMMADTSLDGIGATAGGREKAWSLVEAWDREGLEIARALKAELPDWTVYYYDSATMIEAAGGRPSCEFGMLVENR